MSINVVVSSTAAGVSVSGGTSVAITVSGSTAAAITVGGGIGPAGFLINPGTATNAFGTFQLAAGDGVTISTSAAQFTISSYGTTAVSSLAPVQSVAGRTGNVVLQAADVTAGTFAIARIPTISYTALANVPTSVAPSAHTHSTTDVVSFTAAAAAAAPVQSVAGRSGAVSLAVADVSGLAAVASSGSYTSLQNVPATFAPQAHTHSTADITGFTGSFAAGNHTHDASAIASGVLELARIPTIGYTALAGVPATFAPQAHTHSTADVVGITASFSQVGHAHQYVQALNGLTGTLSITAGAGVTVSTASSSITIAAAGGGAGGDVDGGDYVGVIASISVTQQPADASISINQGSTGSASFTVAASASTGAPVDYQWERNQGSAWATINAATSATLSLTGLSGADDGTLYRCIVSAFGLPAVTSNAASLDVAVIVPAAPVITITTQPQPATIASTASTASFSITASVNSGTLLYQWQRRGRGATTFVDISGATGSTLSLSGLTYSTDRETYYRCRLTATGAAAVVSSSAQLAINWATAPQITITDGPSTVNWPPQSNVCTVTYGEQIFGATTTTRQWQAFNGTSWVTPVPSVLSASNVPYGTTGSSLTLYVINRAVTVRCVVTSTNSYGTTTATTGAITVNRPVAV